MENAGFSLIVARVCDAGCCEHVGELRLQSALRADPFLARLTDEAFEARMAELRAHAVRAASDQTVVEELDGYVFATHTT